MNLLPMIIEQNKMVICPNPFSMERVSGFVSHGLTIREILDTKNLATSPDVSARVLVEDLVIPEILWDTYRPLPGSLIIVRAVPMGGNGDNKSVMRAILMIAVVAFSMYVGAPYVGIELMGLAKDSMGVYALGVGMGTVGSMLLNALIPPPLQKLDERTGLDITRSPSLSGASNQINKYGPIPKILGKHKITPPFAAEPYTSFNGNDQYLHLLFCIGYGPLLIEDLKIGDTDLTKFDDIYYEGRAGYDSDSPLNIAWTVHEEALSILLKQVDGYHIRTTEEDVREIIVDLVCPTGMFTLTADGKKGLRSVHFEIQYAPTGTSDWSIDSTYTHFDLRQSPIMTAPVHPIDPDGILVTARADVVCLDKSTGEIVVVEGYAGYEGYLTLPAIPIEYAPLAGVIRIKGESAIVDGWMWDMRDSRLESKLSTDFETTATSPASNRVEVAAGDLLMTSAMQGRSSSTLRKSFRFRVSEGQYDVRIKRITTDAAEGSTLIYDEVYWTSLKNVFHENPIALSNIASIYLRVRATEQLNGIVQNFSCVVTSVIRDWTGAAWEYRTTNNPASLFREILQGLGNNRPLADARIDLTALQTWHGHCNTNGFTYNQPIDFRSSIEDMLREVAAAGRAVPSYIDGKYSIVEDVEQATPIQHFTPRNSWGFSSDKRFVDMPHGFRCLFPNEDKDYVEDERIVYDDGYHSGNATDFEMLQLPGVTDKDAVWKHGRYHIAAARLRPETYSWYADVENIVCTRGDLVRVSHDVPLWGVAWGRVKEIQVDNGNTTGVTMDEEMPMELEESYCIRFRKSDGISVLCNVVLDAGIPKTIVFTTPVVTADGPAVGDLGLFGKRGSESVECIIKNIEPGPELSARIVAVDAAAAIYDSDTGTIPAFDSQITLPFNPLNAIGLPVIDTIRSDETVLVRQIDGSFAPRILITFIHTQAFMYSLVEAIEIEYRLSDSDDLWKHVEIPITVFEVSLVDVEDSFIYDIRCRYRLIEKQVSEWLLRENYTVIGLSSSPPDIEWLMINDMLLTWKYPVVPLDWAGFELRYHNGRLNQSWESAHKVQDGLITTTFYDATAVGTYEKTFLLKAVDIAGNYSENAATLITDLGDPVVDNLVESVDYEALNFPGTITDGSIVGDDIVADETAGGVLLWSDDSSAYWSKDDSATLWIVSYLILQYEFDLLPVLVDVDSGLTYSNPRLFLEYELEGISPLVEYVTGGDNLFWEVDSILLWSSDSTLLWSSSDALNDWPGSLSNLKRQRYTFLITIQGGRIQGKVKELEIVTDVPDVEETLEDVSIEAAGTRLSLTKTFISIKVVNMVLQDDGGSAMSLVAIDKLRTGPLIKAYTEGGVATTAVIDARIQGY